jgi:catechol 2,3-dioxygenase-like lactoylglutathione lyase family enzyme
VRIMTIVLNHTIVPVRDKTASARFFAELFGLKCEPIHYFAPVRLNDQMTFLFSDETPEHESHHYAFHVSDVEFDAIFDRIKAAGLRYGSDPGDHENGKLNDLGGGRGVYFKDPDGHLLELMTVPQ